MAVPSVAEGGPAVTVSAPPAVPLDVAACLRAYEAGDRTGAESTAGALARKRATGKRSRRADAGTSPLEQVGVWSALALARRARGDDAGAAAAFEAGARWAAVVEARRMPAALDGLAPSVGRHLLTVGEAAAAGSAERRLALRLAATWLGASAAAGPGDADLATLAARAAEGFVADVQAEVDALVARREFGAAHGAIDDALGGVAVPEGRRGELRDLLWTSITGEVGRLVTQALRERDGGAGGAAPDAAMAALAAAAEVVAGVPAECLTADRRRDLARRLWWAHVQLGGARRARGDLEAAVTPLLHALELAEGDEPREAEARKSLARVIEGLAERLGEDSHDRFRRGDLDGAMAASRRLSEVVDAALARGLSPTDLAGALARRQELMLELAQGRPA